MVKGRNRNGDSHLLDALQVRVRVRVRVRVVGWFWGRGRVYANDWIFAY